MYGQITMNNKYRELLLYLLFGICTVAVNTVTYSLCYNALQIDNIFATIIAWFVAVVFAFITNRRYVFAVEKTDREGEIKECARFFLCRFLSGILDIGIMAIAVSWLQGNSVFWKLISNVVVTVANYLASKLWVFSKSINENRQ